MSWIRVTLALLLLAFTATAEVVPLTDDTFEENVNTDHSLWFINFYTNWCPFSQRLAPAWEQLGADEKVRQAGVRIGAVDCQANIEACRKARVQGYPKMTFYFDGEKFQGNEDNYGEDIYGNYYGDRDVESMKAFALEKQAQIAPLKITGATAGVNSTREDAPRFSVDMVLKLFGF